MAAPDPATPEEPAAEALRIFVSYSRSDMAQADALVASLEGHGFEVQIDRRDLHYGEEWQKELSEFIAASDTVIWLVSPESIQSRWCNWELGEVGRLSKRLVPVRIADIDPDALPKQLGRIHLLPAGGVYQAADHEGALVDTLNADRAWLKRATALGEDAREWVRRRRDASLLLRGSTLAEAEIWTTRRPRDAPAVPTEVLELILASRRGQRRRQRMTVVGSLTAAVVGITLAALAFWFQQRAQEQAAEADRQREAAVQNELRAEAEAEQARRNETIGVAAMSRVALSDEMPAEAVKLALAAWPRVGDARRPMLKRTIESMANALPLNLKRVHFTGHRGAINTAAYSADRRFVVTASEDATARLWDASTGKELAVLEGHASPVYEAGFSFDGTRILTRSGSGGPRLWDVTKAALVAVLTDGTEKVEKAEFSRDGHRVLTVSKTGGVKLWHSVVGKLVATFSARGDSGREAIDAIFSPDRTRIAARYSDNYICIWEVATGRELPVRQLSARDVVTIAFSPDGGLLAVVTPDGAYIVNSSNGLEYTSLSGHSGPVNNVIFSPDSKLVVTLSDDTTARVWNLDSRTSPLVLKGHEQYTSYAAFSPDMSRLITASYEFQEPPRLWNVETGKEIARLAGHEGAVYSAQFSPDGTQILTSGPPYVGKHENPARIWDGSNGALLHVLKGHTDEIVFSSFSSDGMHALTASRDGTAWLWSTGSVRKVPLHRKNSTLRAIALSPDRQRVFTLSTSGTVSTWNGAGAVSSTFDTGLVGQFQISTCEGDGEIVLRSQDSLRLLDLGRKRVRYAVSTGDRSIRDFRISRQCDFAVLVADDERAYLVDIAGAKFHSNYALTRNSRAKPIDIAPDGRKFLTISAQGKVYIWDLRTGAEILSLNGDPGNALTAKFSADGTTVATTSTDLNARIWNTDTGRLAQTFGPLSDGMEIGASASPDGTRLLTASGTTAELWDAANGSKVVDLVGHDDWRSPPAAGFSGDGVFVVTASGDDGASLEYIIQIWDARSGNHVAAIKGQEVLDMNEINSSDSRRVITSSTDHIGIRISDISTGTNLLELAGLSGFVKEARFLLGGTRILTATSEGSVHIWDISALEKGDAFQVACQRLGSNTSLKDVQERYGLGELTPICGDNPPLPVDWSKVQ